MGATQSTTQSHVLETSRGKLEGIQQSDLSGTPILTRYAKIPFAAPPVGGLRFRRPQSLPSDYTFSDSSGQPGDYTKFGPICPQPLYNTGAALVDNPDAAPEIENTESEDCLYLNIWVPAGTPPPAGWPVQVFIHGGWLQIGDANQTNSYDPFDLLAHSTKRIMVAPTYRLNIFGFLAGGELASAEPNGDPAPGNYGLWDQRMALEWIYANISLFSGNPANITLGGLSAGSHSAFLQLYHDTYQPPEKRIIKQAYFWSNAIAIQPNPSTSETLTSQYHELCTTLNIPPTSSPIDRLAALRAIPAPTITSSIPKLKMHTFRTSTDGAFVPANFLRTIHDGSFTARLADHNIRIILGEVRDEALLYKLVNPPSTRAGLLTQLGNYYPGGVVEALVGLRDVYDIPSQDAKEEEGEEQAERFKDVFARMVADLQVHASIRGMSRCLLAPPGGGPVPEVLRYRICWRAESLDGFVKKEVGVCHAADNPIWWCSGYRAGFNDGDKAAVDDFLKPFGEMIEGKEWKRKGNEKGVERAKRIDRVFEADGTVTENVEDEFWEKGIRVWDAIAEVQGVKS